MNNIEQMLQSLAVRALDDPREADLSAPGALAYADQVAAASAAHTEPVGLEHLPAPRWALLRMYRVLAGWVTCYDPTCQHMPSTERPEPVAASSWFGDCVVCLDCSGRDVGFVTPSGECSNCGCVSVGVLQLRTGALAYYAETCEVCARVG